MAPLTRAETLSLVDRISETILYLETVGEQYMADRLRRSLIPLRGYAKHSAATDTPDTPPRAAESQGEANGET